MNQTNPYESPQAVEKSRARWSIVTMVILLFVVTGLLALFLIPVTDRTEPAPADDVYEVMMSAEY